MNTYDVGDLVRVAATFANSGGTAVDPTVLTLKVRPADSTATTYTYGTGVTIVRSAAGSYYADITVTARLGGMWYYAWTATGTYVGMGQGSFAVRETETG